MMLIVNNANWRRGILSLILIWATVFFWLLNSTFIINLFVSAVALLCFVAILWEKSAHFTTIYLSFLTAYVLYGYILVNNFPIWLAMIGIMLVFFYLFAYLEEMSDLIPGEKPIYLMVFSLLAVETFLFLGYYIISPINRSLILSAVVYLIFGFLESCSAGKSFKSIVPYVLVFLLVFVTMLLTASWGQI